MVSASILPEHVKNAAKARALYTAKQLPQDFLADWHFAVREARRLVATALRTSGFLMEIRRALEQNCGHSLVFRHLMAPPVSQDQFKLICPEWSKHAEKNLRPARKIAAEAANRAILARLDPGLVRWVVAGTRPSHRDLRVVLRVTAALIAQQTVATARRTRLAFEQEYAAVDLLLKDGWTQLPSKVIDTRAAVPPKHFMHKTRFATNQTSRSRYCVRDKRNLCPCNGV